MLARSEIELTTAATDLLLGVVCLGLAWRLAGLSTAAAWQQQIWVAVLILLSCGALLGAIVHGVELRDAVRAALWKPLYLSLGLAVALVVVCATSDWLGEPAGRRALPWAAVTGVAFVVFAEVRGGRFALFLAWEAVAMLFALAAYVALARHDQPGAASIAAGLAVTLLAAAVQASDLSVRAVVRFDHNGLFHLVQLIGVSIIAVGVRASLLAR